MSDAGDTTRLGRFMQTERVPCDPHDVYLLRNRRHGSDLGFIEWYQPWRCYVVQFDGDAALSADCLRDVAGFLETLNRPSPPPAKREAEGTCEEPAETLCGKAHSGDGVCCSNMARDNGICLHRVACHPDRHRPRSAHRAEAEGHEFECFWEHSVCPGTGKHDDKEPCSHPGCGLRRDAACHEENK